MTAASSRDAAERCGTCTWWTPDVTIEAIRGKAVKVQGVCGGIATCWDWRLENGDPGDDKAMLVDANATLITRADFGCGLWRARRSTETPREGKS